MWIVASSFCPIRIFSDAIQAWTAISSCRALKIDKIDHLFSSFCRNLMAEWLFIYILTIPSCWRHAASIDTITIIKTQAIVKAKAKNLPIFIGWFFDIIQLTIAQNCMICSSTEGFAFIHFQFTGLAFIIYIWCTWFCCYQCVKVLFFEKKVKKLHYRIQIKIALITKSDNHWKKQQQIYLN